MDFFLSFLPLKILLHEFHFQVFEEFVFPQLVEIAFALRGVKLLASGELFSFRQLIFFELHCLSFEGIRSIRDQYLNKFK